MLSDRQLELLKIIIEEHLDSSEPIGSTYLVEKYNLRYSAATVRNEMARMLEEGFLQMLHASSGRVPTPMAYKFFLTEVMEEEELPVLQEVAIKQRLWSQRFDFYKLLREAATSLADAARELAIITTDDGYVVHSGEVNLLDNREFWDIDAAKAALHLADRYELLERVFKKASSENSPCCIFGDELGNGHLTDCSMLFMPYSTDKSSGHVAVLGPARTHYATVIPALKYTKVLIEELTGSW